MAPKEAIEFNILFIRESSNAFESNLIKLILSFEINGNLGDGYQLYWRQRLPSLQGDVENEATRLTRPGHRLNINTMAMYLP